MTVQFTSARNSASNCRAGYIIAGVYDKDNFTVSAKELDEISNGAVTTLISNNDLKNKVGSCALISPLNGSESKRALVVRLGRKSKLNANNFQKAIAGVAGFIKAATPDNAVFFLDDLEVEGHNSEWIAKRTVEIINDSLYVFAHLKKANKKRRKKWRIQLSVTQSASLKSIRSGIRLGKAISNGVNLAKDLGNLPGNVCTPTYLAERATELANESNLDVEVLSEEQMEELGMGSLLSVSRGSREPAKLIIMNYRGTSEDTKPIVLVGKGLTFDAGGISIKPASSMDEMKFDMCGGAGVIGAMSAVAELKLPLNVIGVVPSSENLPDGAANKPGDIVTSMNGTTIEILNTDAEGRLILCDALTYVERFEPDTVVDAATLTGACVIALGRFPSGLFSSDEELVAELVEAGNISGDRVWPMPLWDDYQGMLDSNFADVANIGGRDAGAVTAACFLARFTKKFRWAHLDVAGTAWLHGKAKGSTGRPVYLFMQFLLGRCNTKFN